MTPAPTPEQALDAALAPLRDGGAFVHLGVAVSGGGDSMALLHLAHSWAAARGIALSAATVDHGLRAAAAAEAAGVARACDALGIPHATLRWTGWDGQGNLQAAARSARRALLADWAAARGLTAILLGHTADDQAETVLMRLARGSGVDGLAAMAAADATGLFRRPLLTQRRGVLRDWLRQRGIGWVEDPSNDDPRFDRVRARAILAALAPLGLNVDRLTDTAAHMAAARHSLRKAAADWARAHVRAEGGDLCLPAAALDLDGGGDLPARVLSAALCWIGNTPYRPRHDALTDAAAALRRGQARTLGGVILQPDGAGGARLMREPAAVAPPVILTGTETGPVVWDGRWQVSPPPGGAMPAAGGWQIAALQIAALGAAGLAQCPDWRATGLPRRSLLTTPAIWHDGTLIAAPLAGLARDWQAGLSLSFDRFILSH